MDNAAGQTDKKNKYIARMRLSVQSERLTLRPPRLGLAILLGFSTFVASVIYSIGPWAQVGPALGDTETMGMRLARLTQQPWFPLVSGLAVYFLVSRGFRGKITMDRRENELRSDGATLCQLDQVLAVEVDTRFRSFAMNQVALRYQGDRRLPLLWYDSRPNKAVWKFAEAVGEFLRVPVRGEVISRPD